MPSLAVIVFYLEVAGLSNVINVCKNNCEYCNQCSHCGSGKHILRDYLSTKYKKQGGYLTVLNEWSKLRHICKSNLKRNVNDFKVNNIFSCKTCNLVYFCDEDCKCKKWKQNQILCKSITILQK